MKKVIGYNEFCKQNRLNNLSKESQAKYLSYTKEVEKENRPYYDEINRKAKEIKEKLSKKK
ncbi:hypothetical protein [Malaciobacter marinus]|uniref:hypothetical protein n=1 Tax=Malaciobacter marinus TaxID=505249 RepID=UPI003AFFC665